MDWIFYISLHVRIQSINKKISHVTDYQQVTQEIVSIHIEVQYKEYVVVVVFFALTDRASTIPSNTRGCQSGTWSAAQKKIRGTSTKLQ